VSAKTALAVGLDAGSAWTRCAVCAVEDMRIRLLGHCAVASQGWTKGRIDNQPMLADSIRQAVDEAGRMAQVTVESVVAGIGGPTIQGVNGRGLYEFGWPREIEHNDLGFAVDLASRARLEDGRMLLQVFPQDFTVDGRAGFRNPTGLTCERLEAHAQLITVATAHHQALVSTLHQAHLSVEETVFEPVAAAYAAVLKENRSRGVALVDIGAHSTGIAIYDGEALQSAASLPIGGELFTRDVAFGLCVSFNDAELLKAEYGCALLGLTSDSSIIEIPPHDGRPAREARRRDLNEILEARADELFQFILRETVRARMDRSLLEGVVLTGGGSLLNGMCDIAERLMNCQARNGLPVGVENWPDELDNPAWTTAAGLAMYAGRLKSQRETRNKPPGFMGLFFR
jgi:cell division protein FtsA